MKEMESFLNGSRCYLIKYCALNKQTLFFQDNDYKFYLYLLRKFKARFRVNVFGFCLIPNSVYLIIQPYEDDNLTAFMHHLCDAYSIYYMKYYLT